MWLELEAACAFARLRLHNCIKEIIMSYQNLKAVCLAALWVVLAYSPGTASAGFIDLTPTASTSSGVQAADNGGNFIVTNTTLQPTGTGVIDSFLRIQQTGQERGYNTSAGTPLDDVGGIFTRNLQLGAIPTVTIGGVVYREFLLDVNQITNGTISLNQVQIFTSSAAVGTAYTLAEASPTQNAEISFANANEVFQLSSRNTSAATSYEIAIDSGHGSGSGDMYLYVKDSLFTGLGAGTYVTLFSQLGLPPGYYPSNAGFEEWAVMGTGGGGGPTVVPVPPALILLASGVPVVWISGFFRRRKPAAA
jgi:hypothetical protein